MNPLAPIYATTPSLHFLRWSRALLPLPSANSYTTQIMIIWGFFLLCKPFPWSLHPIRGGGAFSFLQSIEVKIIFGHYIRALFRWTRVLTPQRDGMGWQGRRPSLIWVIDEWLSPNLLSLQLKQTAVRSWVSTEHWAQGLISEQSLQFQVVGQAHRSFQHRIDYAPLSHPPSS